MLCPLQPKLKHVAPLKRERSIRMQPALIKLDNKQPATTLKTDNSNKEGFVKLGMKQKRSKTWDMKWHWLNNKKVIDQLRVY